MFIVIVESTKKIVEISQKHEGKVEQSVNPAVVKV